MVPLIFGLLEADAEPDTLRSVVDIFCIFKREQGQMATPYMAEFELAMLNMAFDGVHDALVQGTDQTCTDID